ncbi:IucA/IucC family protein [Paenibacillus enshidis]|uniref:IucA/IucC family protein n=1 Tax=Paenibacillus enshidis TaxID=1458439 RepID=A0ABV5AVL6_9BACL
MAQRSLLNAFLRENGDAVESPHKLAEAAERGEAFPLSLRLADGARIRGMIRYASLTGQHLYAEGWVLERDGAVHPLTFDELAGALVSELAQRFNLGADQNTIAVLQRIRRSVSQLSGHLERWMEAGKAGRDVRRLDYITSEQSVFAGHPFHPYPKSSEGMSESEQERYSPERGVDFALYYFAVHASELCGEWLPGEQSRAFPPEAHAPFRQALSDRLGAEAEALYRPLPMHPWQALRLLERPWVRASIQQGKIIPLGPLGPRVFPTSSVRTVWEPQSGCGWKLPLEVRITNLIRVNTPEQTARTIDAARLTAHLGEELAKELLGLLPETGYVGIAAPGQERTDPAFTVLFRPMDFEPSATFVLASVLESWPGEQTPKLAQAITASAQAGGGLPIPDIKHWLERYLRLSMLPLLRVWDRFGISFEAHAQNSLLSLKDGWPSCFYTRDLEGMSVDRELARKAGWIGGAIGEDSPLLYAPDEAWHRTKYYFFVNHLGSLIHALALWQGRSEREGWAVVRRLLLEERERSSERQRPYVDELLNGEELPAKANFASCLANKGDTPLYISIPNPIRGV